MAKGKNKGKSAAHRSDDRRKKPPMSAVMTGRIQGNAKGFGFFVPDDGSDDLFVPPRALHGALHGDTVEAVKVSANRGAGEAEVVRIVARGMKSIVGTFDNGFVVPDCQNLAKDIYIPTFASMGAHSGEKVVVEITDYPVGRKPEGKVVEILGKQGAPGVDILSIIRAHDLIEEFPVAVLSEARKVPQTVSAEQCKDRRDYRDETIITIDGDDSKDFDDAIGLKIKANGNYRLGVHIADVAEYVRAGSKLDKEAYKRGTSVYLCDRVLPMLPVELSNGICSLNEGVDRLTLSVIVELDKGGNIVKSKIREGVIRSKARTTYTQVAAILDGDEALRDKYADIVPMLENMKQLADVRRYLRVKRGCIDFDLSESKIDIDRDTGKVLSISKYPRLISHQIVEEFMLIANEVVAEQFAALKCPFVYRVHQQPPTEKVESFLNFLSALGIAFKGDINNPQPTDYAQLLSTIDESVSTAVNRVALRSMSKATYEPVNQGHFGLAAPFYCHFTSPIRRYPDLAAHRIIKDYLRNGQGALKKYAQFARDAATRSSERERLAEAAEREVDDLKKAEYMAEHIGERYVGVISGVTEWGIFVELDNSVEGLVRTDDLPDGGYVYNADLMRLDNHTHSYRLGDTVAIVVFGVTGSRVAFRLDEAGSDAAD